MKSHGVLKVEKDRIIRLESEVENIKDDVGEIKTNVSDIRKSNITIEKALVKLSMIADSNQRLEPRITSLEKIVWRAIGGATTIVTGAGFVAVVVRILGG